MTDPRSMRAVLVLPVVVLALLAFAIPAFADSSWTEEFDAGIACEDFAVRVEIVYDHEVFREFKGKDGNTRGLFVGNSDITLTNLSTGKTMTFQLNGSAFHDTYYPDGSLTSANTGNVFVILFPTDVYAGGEQAGPSMKLYSGRFTFHADADFNWTVESIKGRSSDLCAALAG